MGANIAGIYGAQIFRQDDRPRYHRAFAIGIGILSFAIILSIIRHIDDIFRRRRAANRLDVDHNSTSEDGADIEKAVEKGVPPPSSDQPAPILLGSDLKPVVSNKVIVGK